MLKKLFALAAAATIMTGALIAQEAPKEEVKPIDVKVCPMTLGKVAGEGVAPKVVGAYKVYFCCEGCPKAFDKLSKEDQEKKALAAAKKQEENEKKPA